MPGFSGQGKVYIGTSMIQSGIRQPDDLVWIGDASEFRIKMDVQSAQRNESFTGLRQPHRTLIKSRSGSLMVKFDEWNASNLALALNGSSAAVAAGTAVTNYTYTVGKRVGSILVLPAPNVTAVVVKDSTGAPITLVAGVDYRLDAARGTIEILRLQAFVQPFKVDFTPGAHTKVGALNTATRELFVRLDGVNTDDNTTVIANCFRIKLSPAKELALINNDFNDFELDGDLLADTGRAFDSADGQFFNIVLP